jgi:DNA helicase-2/ATP-dependent DNA helicase PcrA
MNRSEYEKMLRTEGSQERLDNLAELKQSIYEYETTCGEETTLESYLSHIALFTNTDTVDSSDKVKLMTVHAAKGLEFPNVFLCGMNEGVFPSRKTKTLESMEEERRLAFVAVTRAKERLYLSESEGKNFDGTYRYPSRFIFDIDEKLLEFHTKPDEKLLQEAREYIYLRGKVLEPQINQDTLEEGDRVRHIVFGEGKILEKDTEQMAYVIKFDGINTTRRIAFRVKLEKITGKEN